MRSPGGRRGASAAFALFASVNIKLHGLDDSVIGGEICARAHTGDVRSQEGGAAIAKRGQTRSKKNIRIITVPERSDSAETDSYL